MSALTDLFTALANKIRSKTGTATTYTPLEMVSDGIDDVYDAGYAAGGGGATGIPITPSNAAPVTLTNGESYSMLANGYAVSSYTSINPSDSSPVPLSAQTIYRVTNGSNGGYAIASYSSVTPSNSSPVSLSSGSIYKMGGAGKAVESVTSITPYNQTPPEISAGNIYKATVNGYAIQTNPESLTPNNTSPPIITSGTIYRGGGSGNAIASIATNGNGVTPSSSGQYFYSGWNRMTSAGYAYSSQPSSGYTYGWNSATSLWTNSSSTSAFAAQTITVSNISSYTYLKINYVLGTNNTNTDYIIISRSKFQSSSSAQNSPKYGLNYRATNQVSRYFYYVSNTQIAFSTGYVLSTTQTSNNYCIPSSIEGLK